MFKDTLQNCSLNKFE